MTASLVLGFSIYKQHDDWHSELQIDQHPCHYNFTQSDVRHVVRHYNEFATDKSRHMASTTKNQHIATDGRG